MRKHIVKKGENLYSISKQYYGIGQFWRLIYIHNKHIIGTNPNIIKPGLELSIL